MSGEEKPLMGRWPVLLLPRMWVWLCIDSVSMAGKLFIPTGGEARKKKNTFTEKTAVSIQTQQQQRSQTETSSKMAMRWTPHNSGVDCLWVRPLWGAQHTSVVLWWIRAVSCHPPPQGTRQSKHRTADMWPDVSHNHRYCTATLTVSS